MKKERHRTFLPLTPRASGWTVRWSGQSPYLTNIWCWTCDLPCPNSNVFILTFRKIMMLTWPDSWSLKWIAYIADMIKKKKELCKPHFENSCYCAFHGTTAWVKFFGFLGWTLSAPICQLCRDGLGGSSSEQGGFDLIRHREVEGVGLRWPHRGLAAPTFNGPCIHLAP